MFVFYTISADERLSKNQQIENLLKLISNGENTALEKLYDLIKTDIFSYALSKLKNKPDAEDIMQDTFVNLFKYAKQYKPKGKPLAWIFTIELNLIRRHLQLKTRNVELDEKILNVAEPNDILEKTINNLFLQQLLSNLEEEEREIISLHVVSGLKHREIAKLLHKNLSTILSKYNRAIKKLQLLVREQN